jgi:cob(I)alamin adenosyltransferase
MKNTSKKSLIIVFTGNGKGKTTAALGTCMRAMGHGMKACVLQFLKGDRRTGEAVFARSLRPCMKFLIKGRGFTWLSRDIGRDVKAAKRAWQTAKKIIGSGEYDLVVLDELTYLLRYNIVSAGDIREALQERPGHVSIIITGRHAPVSLIRIADVVTVMQEKKHPFRKKSLAVRGLDY